MFAPMCSCACLHVTLTGTCAGVSRRSCSRTTIGRVPVRSGARRWSRPRSALSASSGTSRGIRSRVRPPNDNADGKGALRTVRYRRLPRYGESVVLVRRGTLVSSALRVCLLPDEWTPVDAAPLEDAAESGIVSDRPSARDRAMVGFGHGRLRDVPGPTVGPPQAGRCP